MAMSAMVKVAHILAIVTFKSASCFHTKRRDGSASLRHRCQFQSTHQCALAAPSSTTLVTSGNGQVEPSEEERLRQEATDALLPVFFPTADVATRKPISAEAALKKLLRKKYQRHSTNTTESALASKSRRDGTRGRLAALILGTSVMRLRHWYDAVMNLHACDGTAMPIPHPLAMDTSLCSFVLEKIKNGPCSSSDDAAGSEVLGSGTRSDGMERELVRAMIDRHAHQLLSAYKETAPGLSSSTDGCNSDAIEISIEYSLPTFITSSILSHYGPDQTKRICSLMNNPGPITVRKNAMQFTGTDEELCKWLREEDGVHARPLAKLLQGRNDTEWDVTLRRSHDYIMGSSSKWGVVAPPEGAVQIIPPLPKSIWSIRGWQNGYFEVQDAGSQLIVQSLEVEDGESILDYCAGNGGKTFALASEIAKGFAMHGNADVHSQIVAHDVVDERLRQIKGSLSRVGFSLQGKSGTNNGTISGLATVDADRNCTVRLTTSSDLDSTHKLNRFDAVLVDAPCSSVGVLRRRPSQRWDLTKDQIACELPDLQLSILKRAATAVKGNGGRLVYSTCSIMQEENEAVARKFEKSRVFSELGFEPWGFKRDVEDASHTNAHLLTLLPSKKGSDGFFVARWRRTTQAATECKTPLEVAV